METVPSPTDNRTYAGIAAELHRIADDLAKLIDEPDPACFTIYLQPSRAETDAEVRACVDAVTTVLYGAPGEHKAMSCGDYHYARYGYRGAIDLNIFQSVSGPPDERDMEIARLRAENAELRAARDTGYGREPDNGDDTAPIPPGVYGEHEGAPAGRTVDGA